MPGEIQNDGDKTVLIQEDLKATSYDIGIATQTLESRVENTFNEIETDIHNSKINKSLDGISEEDNSIAEKLSNTFQNLKSETKPDGEKKTDKEKKDDQDFLHKLLTHQNLTTGNTLLHLSFNNTLGATSELLINEVTNPDTFYIPNKSNQTPYNITTELSGSISSTLHLACSSKITHLKKEAKKEAAAATTIQAAARGYMVRKKKQEGGGASIA